MKFLFPNQHAVYLHDTPQHGLFRGYQRSLSHGCVRVERAFDLALALLGQEGWTAEHLQEMLTHSYTSRATLGTPVPVYLDYITAFVDERGRLNIRPDLYGHDARGEFLFEAMPDPTLTVSSGTGEGALPLPD